MDKIEKLLRKTKKADRMRLLKVLESLRQGHLEGLHVKRLVNSKYYRIRIGDFRIIFSIDQTNKSIFVESVSLRDEKTYQS